MVRDKKHGWFHGAGCPICMEPILRKEKELDRDELRRHIQAMIGGLKRYWDANCEWLKDGMHIVGGSKNPVKIIYFPPDEHWRHDDDDIRE